LGFKGKSRASSRASSTTTSQPSTSSTTTITKTTTTTTTTGKYNNLTQMVESQMRSLQNLPIDAGETLSKVKGIKKVSIVTIVHVVRQQQEQTTVAVEVRIEQDVILFKRCNMHGIQTNSIYFSDAERKVPTPFINFIITAAVVTVVAIKLSLHSFIPVRSQIY